MATCGWLLRGPVHECYNSMEKRTILNAWLDLSDLVGQTCGRITILTAVNMGADKLFHREEKLVEII
jgi:hypothetical protein